MMHLVLLWVCPLQCVEMTGFILLAAMRLEQLAPLMKQAALSSGRYSEAELRAVQARTHDLMERVRAAGLWQLLRDLYEGGPEMPKGLLAGGLQKLPMRGE